MLCVIDVFVLFDIEIIFKKYLNFSKNLVVLMLIDWCYVYMVINQDNVIFGQVGGEFDLKVQVGDLICWCEMSLLLGFENQVVFYKFIGNVGNDLILMLMLCVVEVLILVLNISKFEVLMCQKVVNYYWLLECLKVGCVIYYFQFQIIDCNCQSQGCFLWDLFILIYN